jgi:hypothetical protein
MPFDQLDILAAFSSNFTQGRRGDNLKKTSWMKAANSLHKLDCFVAENVFFCYFEMV